MSKKLSLMILVTALDLLFCLNAVRGIEAVIVDPLDLVRAVCHLF